MLNLAGSTAYIELEDGTIVTDPDHIFEFYNNCPSTIVKQVKAEITKINSVASIKPVDVICENENCNKPFKIAIEYDFASFFAVGS